MVSMVRKVIIATPLGDGIFAGVGSLPAGGQEGILEIFGIVGVMVFNVFFRQEAVVGSNDQNDATNSQVCNALTRKRV